MGIHPQKPNQRVNFSMAIKTERKEWVATWAGALVLLLADVTASDHSTDGAESGFHTGSRGWGRGQLYSPCGFSVKMRNTAIGDPA